MKNRRFRESAEGGCIPVNRAERGGYSADEADGFDCDAMYDVTRNTILAQNVMIPYPMKYWTAEVCLEGFRKGSTAYLFSVER